MIGLVPGAEEEYERRHAQIWPEMRDALSAAGYRNYTLFRRGATVIGYVECSPDAATAASAMAATDVAARWNDSFSGVIDSLVDSEGNLQAAHELWHLA